MMPAARRKPAGAEAPPFRNLYREADAAADEAYAAALAWVRASAPQRGEPEGKA